MLRILLDENCASTSLADYLRSLGHDVVTVYDVKLEGASDEEVADYACIHERVIVTHNGADFSFPYLYQRCGGVISLEQMSPRQIKLRLTEFLNEYGETYVKRKFVHISRNSVIRK